VTKAELIVAIATKLKTQQTLVKPVVDALFESIADALANGEKCTFIGFGTFETKDRAAREGRNPQNPAKIIKIPAKKVPVFRAGKGLKEKVLNAAKGKKKSKK
jgi:DNA-binding protein HU-beta